MAAASRGIAIGVLVGVFALGGVTGLGVARVLRPEPSRPTLPGALGELDLRPDQEAAARAILDRHRVDTERVMEDALPRLRAIQQQIDAELGAIRDPTQREKLAALRASRPPPLPPPR